MASHRKVRNIVCLLLAAAVLSTSSACRPSPTLMEPVYDDSAESLSQDASAQTIENSADNTDPDDTLPPETVTDDSDNSRDRQRENPTPGEGDDGTSPDTQYGDVDSPYSSGQTQVGTQSADQNGGDSSSGSGDTTPAGTPDDAGGGDSGGSSAGDSGTLRQVVDANGATVDVPEQVGTVAAVGNAAVLVEILGGSGRLAATSESMEAGLAASAFSSDSLNCLWDGSGNSILSEKKFQALLDARPQVCLELSGQTTFSEDQLARLTEAGIPYVVLPSMNSGSGICQAVRLVGQILGTCQGVDAGKKADEYLTYYSSTLSDLRSVTDPYSPDGINYDTGETDSALKNGGGVYALYLAGWDAAAEYALHNGSGNLLTGTGMAVTESGYRASPVSWFLSLAGVANSAALSENCYSLRDSTLKYVNPIVNSYAALSLSGGASGADYGTRYILTTAGDDHLGDPEFSCVIAASNAVKTGLEQSALWTNYGINTSRSGGSGYGFTDDGGVLVETTIHGDYSVYVMPSGVSSWADGSAESILIPVWAAWRVRGLVSEDTVRQKITEFYQQFYGLTLSGAELSSILNGN